MGIASGRFRVSNGRLAGEANLAAVSAAPPRPILLHALICIVLTGAFLALFDRLKPLTDMEGYLVDYRLRNGRLTQANPDLVYVSVDKTTYEGDFSDEMIAQAGADDQYFMSLLRGSWPWSRDLWAHAANRLIEAGAKGVLLDFIFPAEKPNDPELKAILDRHSPKIIIGALIDWTDDRMVLMPPSPSLIDADEFGDTSSDPRVGFLNIYTDADGTVRRGQYDFDLNQLIKNTIGSEFANELEGEGQVMRSAVSRAVELLGHKAKLPATDVRPLLRYTGLPETFKSISLRAIIDPVEWGSNYLQRDFFRGKFVVMGPGAAILKDFHRTPFGEHGAMMVGLELLLNHINAAIHGEFIEESSSTLNRGVIAAAGALGSSYCLAAAQRSVSRAYRSTAERALSGTGPVVLRLSKPNDQRHCDSLAVTEF